MPSLRVDDILPCCDFCGRRAGHGVERFLVGTISETNARICNDCLALASEEINVADPPYLRIIGRGRLVASIGVPDGVEAKPTFCSFCGRSRAVLQKLVAGPDGRAICDECTGSGLQLLVQHESTSRRAARGSSLEPRAPRSTTGGPIRVVKLRTKNDRLDSGRADGNRGGDEER